MGGYAAVGDSFDDTDDAAAAAALPHPAIRWLRTMADVYNDGNVRKTVRALLEYASAKWDMEAVLTTPPADSAAVAATDADFATFDGLISTAHGEWLSRMADRYGLPSGAAALLRMLVAGAKAEDRAGDMFGRVWRSVQMRWVSDGGGRPPPRTSGGGVPPACGSPPVRWADGGTSWYW